MINILLADDNIYFSKKLMNMVNKINTIARVVYLATEGKEVLEYISNKDVDIIVLDLKMPIIDGIDILEKLEKKEKYKNSIIVISNYIEMMKKIVNNQAVYGCISKGTSMERIIEKINEIVEYKKNAKNDKMINKRIEKEIQHLGYNMTHNGTIYLFEAIKLLANNQELVETNNLNKDIYPILAKKYNKTVHNIKCNINKATEYMYYECEDRVIKEYFRFQDNKKPTPKLIISTIYSKII